MAATTAKLNTRNGCRLEKSSRRCLPRLLLRTLARWFRSVPFSQGQGRMKEARTMPGQMCPTAGQGLVVHLSLLWVRQNLKAFDMHLSKSLKAQRLRPKGKVSPSTTHHHVGLVGFRYALELLLRTRLLIHVLSSHPNHLSAER